ncbi:sugar transferase [candidate division KSB1 bacterium]|nr:sugar transferase [candidate division KSB1 bacterium]
MKRLFDIVFALLALILVAPLLAVIAMAVKLDSAGPIIYCSERIGKNRRLSDSNHPPQPDQRQHNLYGAPFAMFKFRTMVPNADKLGASITHAGDSRITRLGKVLRKSKLDELPSFLNVLIGEMSLVGPRPETRRWVARYSPAQQRVLSVKPGITGPAQIKYRDEENLLSEIDLETEYLQVMADKLEIDLDYIDHMTIGKDIQIIARTIGALFPNPMQSIAALPKSKNGVRQS